MIFCHAYDFVSKCKIYCTVLVILSGVVDICFESTTELTTKEYDPWKAEAPLSFPLNNFLLV